MRVIDLGTDLTIGIEFSEHHQYVVCILNHASLREDMGKKGLLRVMDRVQCPHIGKDFVAFISVWFLILTHEA